LHPATHGRVRLLKRTLRSMKLSSDASATKKFWYLPELLRIKGGILLREGAPNAAMAAETQ